MIGLGSAFGSGDGRKNRVPLWLKAAYTGFLCILIPVYWRGYGPANFLWGCDIALLVTLVALWRESALLNSMMFIGLFPIEIAWTIDLFAGSRLFGMAYYMFEAERPLFLRGLSLFHVFMPILYLYLLRRLGYDRRALVYQAVLVWLTLVATYLLTDPRDNINLVYGFGRSAQTAWPPLLYLVVEMAVVPLVICFPMHMLSLRFARRA